MRERGCDGAQGRLARPRPADVRYIELCRILAVPDSSDSLDSHSLTPNGEPPLFDSFILLLVATMSCAFSSCGSLPFLRAAETRRRRGGSTARVPRSMSRRGHARNAVALAREHVCPVRRRGGADQLEVGACANKAAGAGRGVGAYDGSRYLDAPTVALAAGTSRRSLPAGMCPWRTPRRCRKCARAATPAAGPCACSWPPPRRPGGAAAARGGRPRAARAAPRRRGRGHGRDAAAAAARRRARRPRRSPHARQPRRHGAVARAARAGRRAPPRCCALRSLLGPSRGRRRGR